MIAKVLAPSVPSSFKEELEAIDHRLLAAFNCDIERWQIFRKPEGKYEEWIMTVSNEDNSYRRLDNRTLKKLREMDIIARWGSVKNYEKHLDEKYNKWHSDEKNKLDHESKWDIKDNKQEWKEAIENAKCGVINAPENDK